MEQIEQMVTVIDHFGLVHAYTNRFCAVAFSNQWLSRYGAPFKADFNLVMQIIMGTALFAGAFLAKQKLYTAHGICQTTVLLLNLVMIGLVMWPAFHQQVEPRLPRAFHKWYYATATVHALLGLAAELLGLYILVVAGTQILPQRLRFTNWRRWMRVELILWSIVVLVGIATYYAWYVAPFL